MHRNDYFNGKNYEWVHNYLQDQAFAFLNFYCNKNAIIAITAIIANNQ